MSAVTLAPFGRTAARGRSRGTLWLAAGALLGALLSPMAGEAATLLPGSFKGGAYGTYATANLGPVASSLGKTANLPCPCQGTKGKTLTNVVDDVSAGTSGGVLKAGAVTSTVYANKTSTTAEVRNTSTIAGLNMLGGLITADAIKAVATVDADKTKIVGSSAGSTFVNLKIGGRPISASVAPNTKVALNGIGTVTLNLVKKGGDGKNVGSLLVEGLTVTVNTANGLGLPVGAKIVVAHAQSVFDRKEPQAIVSGQAYAALANAAIGKVLQNQIGKAAFISYGCLGTDGKTVTNNVTGLKVGNVLSFGAGTSTGFGGPSGGGTLAQSTDTVTGLSALNGVITASTIKAVATETFVAGKRTRSAAGSQFIGLKVLGLPIPINVAPNTTISLPPIGKVVVNEQIIPTGSGGKTVVNGLHITVTNALNLLGLPVGTEIVVAHAEASAKKF